jgi:hypothetical protein
LHISLAPPFPFLPPPSAQRTRRQEAAARQELRLYLSPLDPPASRGPVERRSGRSGVGCFVVLPVSELAFLCWNWNLGGLFLFPLPL